MIIQGRSRFEHATPPQSFTGVAPSWSAQVPAQLLTQRVCVAAVLGTDIAALVVSLGCGLVIASVVDGSVWSLNTASVELALPRSLIMTFVAVGCAVLAYFVAHSHYNRRIPFWAELKDVLSASIAALLLSGLIALLTQQPNFRVLPAVVWLLLPLIIMGGRKLVRKVLAALGVWQLRTVVVGETESARQTLAALTSECALGYDVVAVISPSQIGPLTPGDRWSYLLLQYNAGLLVLSYDASNIPDRRTIEALVRERVPFALMPQLHGLPALGFGQTCFFSQDMIMFSFRNNLARPLARLIKVVFDCAAAFIGVVALAPVLAVIAVLIKLDGGPALYGHPRIGSGGRSFRCLKFRSMVKDSQAVLDRLLATNPEAAAEWAETQKLRQDPRVTAIGRILRMTSLDELPQLFNVLRLEMSLVGPRPIVQAEVPRYGVDIAYYYETRPGLTGLWQVSGRTETSYTQRVQLDTWYVKNWAFWHDVMILARTVPAVLKGRGAC